MKPTIYLVPRWGATKQSDWYAWFVEQVEKLMPCTVHILDMPDWDEPAVGPAVTYLKMKVGKPDRSTFFVGHSVGCQAVLRYLMAELEENDQLTIGGFLFVAGWFNVDADWDSMAPWLNNAELDYKKIAGKGCYKKVILSDNDPYTSDYQKNKERWENRVGAEVTIYPGKSHFNGTQEKEVLDEFKDMMLYAKNND